MIVANIMQMLIGHPYLMANTKDLAKKLEPYISKHTKLDFDKIVADCEAEIKKATELIPKKYGNWGD